MKQIKRHTQSIEIEFSSGGFLLFRATFPVKRKPVVSLSSWYRRVKTAVASSEGIPVWKVKGKHTTIESTRFDRILFEWPGGFAIDLPDDSTAYDYKIILHYLEGLKMACKN